MDPILFFALLVCLFVHPLALMAKRPQPVSRITLVGVVYCDICSTNSFSKQSYFLPGVDVNIKCEFKASTPKIREEMTVSVNRTTDKHGAYKLVIPSVDGVNCVDGVAMESSCRATLTGSSSSSSCKVPAVRSTTSAISVKAKQENHCLYNLNALSYRPSKRNATLCGKQKKESPNSLESPKCFLPYFPPSGFPWPRLPFPFPSLSDFPFPFPFQSPPSLPFPFQSPPSLPFPFQSPPSLPFPFPRLPPFPPTPFLFSPPPPPAFSLSDPRTWLPPLPFLSPPPPPAFSLSDPRTWIPHLPPSPPRSP